MVRPTDKELKHGEMEENILENFKMMNHMGRISDYGAELHQLYR